MRKHYFRIENHEGAGREKNDMHGGAPTEVSIWLMGLSQTMKAVISAQTYSRLFCKAEYYLRCMTNRTKPTLTKLLPHTV